MLSAPHRMRRSTEFRRTIRRGQRSGRAHVVVHVAAVGYTASQAGAEHPARVGFVVGRAVGSAVVRNTVQRRLRHLMRARLADLPPGASVVVRATPAAGGASSATLARDLDQALARALRRATREPAA